MSDVRKYTNLLYELVDNGVLSWEEIGKACLNYMSESDVEDMCNCNDWIIDEWEGYYDSDREGIEEE